MGRLATPPVRLVFVVAASWIMIRSSESPAQDVPEVRGTPGDITGIPERIDERLESSDEDAAIVFGGSLVWDTSKNLRGGVDTNGVASRYLIDLTVALDLESLLGLPNTTAFVDGQYLDGSSGEDLVGDFQVFSNIDAAPLEQIGQAWVQTTFLDDSLRLLVGKLDANVEFAYTLSGGGFLNSSMGFSPTIFVMPTYPAQDFGILAEYTVSENWSARLAVFDGVEVLPLFTGPRLEENLLGNNEVFTIAEIDRRWGEEADGDLGRLVVGGWHHNGTFDRFRGDVQRGTLGFYGTADQWLWNEGSCERCRTQGVAAFAQVAWSERQVSFARWHWGGGLAWTGAFDGRDEDVMGVGVTGVEFSRGTGLTAAREVATELFYQWTLPKDWIVQTDVQVITDPGGVRSRSDAVATTLRVIKSF